MEYANTYAAASAARWYDHAAAVRYDTGLPAFAKVLYVELVNLSKKYGYCFAHNGKLAARFGKSSGQISRTISRLQSRGHITVVLEQNTRRKIYIGANPEGVTADVASEPDAPASASPAPNAAAQDAASGSDIAAPAPAEPSALDEAPADELKTAADTATNPDATAVDGATSAKKAQGGFAKSTRGVVQKAQGSTIKYYNYINKSKDDDPRARELRRLFFDHFVVDEDFIYSLEWYERAAKKWHESPFIQKRIRTLKKLHALFDKLIAGVYAPRNDTVPAQKQPIRVIVRSNDPGFVSRGISAAQLDQMFPMLEYDEL